MLGKLIYTLLYSLLSTTMPARCWTRVNGRLVHATIYDPVNVLHPQPAGQSVAVRTTDRMYALDRWGHGFPRTASTYGENYAMNIVHVPPGHPLPKRGDFVHGHTAHHVDGDMHYYTRVTDIC